MTEREKAFKERLQLTERDIMDSFKFKKSIAYDKATSASLSEAMSVNGDHI